MFKKGKTSAVICLLLVLVVSFAPVVNAASWTTLQPSEHITDVYYNGNFRYVRYNFPRVAYVRFYHGTANGSGMGSVQVDADETKSFLFNAYPLGAYSTGGPPLTAGGSGGVAISTEDFVDTAAFTLTSEYMLEFSTTYTSYATATEKIQVTVRSWLNAYTSSGSYIRSIQRDETSFVELLQDVPNEQFTYTVPISWHAALTQFSDDVAYIVPTCEVSIICVDDSPDIQWDYVRFGCDQFSLIARTDMLLQESLSMQEINDKLDQLIQQPENEKQEATDEGGELADQLTGALPDQSQGFMAGIKKLADAMAYEGTDAELTFPSISLPDIPGVMKSYKLSEEMPIDFGFWVQKIPDKVLTLVQVISTLALVVFAFKELYGLISYAMTLKRGESE